MAISYAEFQISSVSDITAAIKAFVEASEMYDSVTVSDNVVTIADNSETYLTIAVASTTVFTAYSDNITGAAFTLSPESTVRIGVGIAGKSVIVSAFGGDTVSVVLTKSKGGQNMILARWANSTFHAITKDSRVDSTAVIAQGSNSYYSALTSPCASSDSEIVAVPYGSFAISVRCTVIPAPTADTKGLRQTTIGGTKYLTDGVFCLADI